MSDGTEQVASLRLKILDEFSTSIGKLKSELAALETASKKTSAAMGTGFTSISSKLSDLESMGVPGMGKLSSALGTAEAASTSFLGASGLLVAGLAAAGVGAVALGSKMLAAASDGEQAETKLTAAMKAAGTYTDTAVESVGSWAEALLEAKGVGDELSATLVAQGSIMGLSIEKSEKFVSVAADMADITGSVETAFDALTRASTGDERALSTLGKQFGIAGASGKSFAEVLALIEEKTSGNAAAKMETFSGQFKLLGDNIGNMLEEGGKPILEWATSWLEKLNEIITAGNKFKTAMKMDVDTAAYSKLAVALSEVQDAIDWNTSQGYVGKGLKERYDEILAAMVKMRKESKATSDAEEESSADRVKRIKAEWNAKKASYEADVDLAKEASAAKKKIEDEEKTQAKADLKYLLAAHTDYYDKLQKAEEDAAAAIAENRETLKAAMLAGTKKRADSEKAAVKESIKTIEGEIKKWSDQYDKLGTKHQDIIDKMKKTEDEYKDSVKSIKESIAAVDEAIGAVVEANFTDEEKYFATKIKLEKQLAEAEALAEPEDKSKALAAYAVALAKFDTAITQSEINAALRSKSDEISAAAAEASVVKEADAKQALLEAMQDVRKKIDIENAKVSEAFNETSLKQKQELESIVTAMKSAKTEIATLQTQIDNMAAALEEDKEYNLDAKDAIKELKKLEKEIERINKLIEEGAEYNITATTTSSPKRAFTEGIEYMTKKLESLPTSGEYNIQASVAGSSGSGSSTTTNNSSALTLNVTVSGSGTVSAKKLDKELAALVKSKKSELRKEMKAMVNA